MVIGILAKYLKGYGTLYENAKYLEGYGDKKFSEVG